MKTRKSIQLFVMACLAFFAGACTLNIDGLSGNGPVVTETIPAAGFTAITSVSSARVEITRGNVYKVSISEYENLLGHWDIEVVDNSLMIRTKPFTSLINSKAVVYVEMPDSLYEATLTGSGDMKMFDPFDNLEEVTITGSGSFTANTNSHYGVLDLIITGSGSFNMTGTVEDLYARISGSGRMNLNNLAARKAECITSGSGNMYVNVQDQLKATITGSGSIIYTGSPRVESLVSGSGRITHR